MCIVIFKFGNIIHYSTPQSQTSTPMLLRQQKLPFSLARQTTDNASLSPFLGAAKLRIFSETSSFSQIFSTCTVEKMTVD